MKIKSGLPDLCITSYITINNNWAFLGNLFQPLLPNTDDKWDKLKEIEGLLTPCYLQ